MWSCAQYSSQIKEVFKLKKIIAFATAFLLIFLILVSIESVSGVGILSGDCTFYQTISPSGKYFNLTQSSQIHFAWIMQTLFVLGIFLLYVPNLLLFEHNKVKSIICGSVNTLGIIGIFVLFKTHQYIFMMIIICILITNCIVIQNIDNYKNKINLVALFTSLLLLAINIYYLIEHFNMGGLLEEWCLNNAYDKAVKYMIFISKINIACFALFLLPIIVQIVTEIKTLKLRQS